MSTFNDKFPIVSIIIGIYNVKSFIRRGLQYLEEQSFRNFEIILIDDGSTDGSSELCDEIAEQNAQVKVVHKKNAGLGSARNVGLDVACGKYVYFFDVDDAVKPSLLAYCVNQMESKNLDVLFFGFEVITPSRNLHDTVSFKAHEINGNDELRACYVDELLLVRNGNGFAWNKFYRKSFLDKYHLRFENQRIQQDEVFNLLVFPHVERAYISSEVLYTYYIYEKGNTRSRFIPDRFDIYVSIREHFEDLKYYWKLTDSRMDDYLQKRFWSNLVTGIVPNLFHWDCPWTIQEKQSELNRIINHPFTNSCLQYMRDMLNGEGRLYYWAFRKADIHLLKMIYCSLSFLRKVKHKLNR